MWGFYWHQHVIYIYKFTRFFESVTHKFWTQIPSTRLPSLLRSLLVHFPMLHRKNLFFLDPENNIQFNNRVDYVDIYYIYIYIYICTHIYIYIYIYIYIFTHIININTQITSATNHRITWTNVIGSLLFHCFILRFLCFTNFHHYIINTRGVFLQDNANSFVFL